MKSILGSFLNFQKPARLVVWSNQRAGEGGSVSEGDRGREGPGLNIRMVEPRHRPLGSRFRLYKCLFASKKPTAGSTPSRRRLLDASYLVGSVSQASNDGGKIHGNFRPTCGWIASIQRALPRPAPETRESNPTDPTNVGSGAGGGGGSGHVVPRQYHKGSAVPFLGPTTDGHVSLSDGVHVHSKGTKGTIPVTGDSGWQSETGVGCLHFLRGTGRPRPRPRTKCLCV